MGKSVGLKKNESIVMEAQYTVSFLLSTLDVPKTLNGVVNIRNTQTLVQHTVRANSTDEAIGMGVKKVRSENAEFNICNICCSITGD